MALTEKMRSELGRHFYVTPAFFLALMHAFTSMCAQKANEIGQRKSRYDNGQHQLELSEEHAAGMQTELRALQPTLDQSFEETTKMKAQILHEKATAAEKEEVIAADEEDAVHAALRAQQIKDECDKELALATPALDAALKALDTVKKSDLSELKSMKSPPPGVVLTMSALCMMFGIKPKRVPNPEDETQKVDDYWLAGKKKLLSKSGLVKKLRNFDKDNINDAVIEALRNFKRDPDFTVESIEHDSRAAARLCAWVLAIELYDSVAKRVAPKKVALKKAERAVDKAEGLVKAKRRERQAMLKQLAGLEEQLKAAEAKQAAIKVQVDDCEQRLSRARRLINGIGGEKRQWSLASERLQRKLETVVGDVLVAAGFVTYVCVCVKGGWCARLKQQVPL